MKKQKTLLILALAFVLLIGGAYVLYNRLGSSAAPQQMIVHAEAQADSATDEAPAGEAPAEEAAAQEESAEEPVVPAPDFTVTDQSGAAVQLSEFIGKPIVLNFWASWCGPCRMEMPDFNEKYREIGDEVHFLMVNMTDGGRETTQTATDFIEESGYAFPVYFDTTGEAAGTYGAYSLPTTFFISAEGHVIAQAVGAIDMATLQKGLDMIAP